MDALICGPERVKTTGWMKSCARPIARHMSPVARVARAGSEREGERMFRVRLLGHDVLEGRPREYREDRVVQTEEEEVAGRLVGDRRSPPADDERNREREKEKREQDLSGTG